MSYAYFHVSETPLPQDPGSPLGQVVLYPRVPERRAPDEDATVPRICVAPTIGACLRMVAWTDYQERFYVYGLVTSVSRAGLDVDTPRRLVPDVGRTSRHVEAWLTRKATFRLLGIVEMDRVALVTGRPCYFWPGVDANVLLNDPDCMTAEDVRRYRDHLARKAAVEAEMEAELRAKGGKLVGDALAEHLGVKP